MSTRRFAAACSLLVILVVCSGCVALGPWSDSNGDDDPAESAVQADVDPEALFEAAYVHGDDLEDVQGDVMTEVTDGDQELTERVRLYERPYVDYRDEVLEAPDGTRVGNIDGSNASLSWWYDAETGVASYHESDDPFTDEEIRSARAEMAADQLEFYDVEYRGTERIADREAHVLDVDAKPEAVERGISVLIGDTEYVYALETIDPEDELEVVGQTLWIDTEYEYPLKEELIFEEGDGTQHTMTERFETVTFNEGLEDDLFAFDPPENATVEEPTEWEE